MKIFKLLAIGLLIIVGCKSKEDLITIVDIGKNDRIKIGKQLRIINGFSPELVALDFYLVPDSLEKDTIIVKELAKIHNTVQVVGLYNFHEELDTWDSLNVSHSKFKVTDRGYSNLIGDNSVVDGTLPMQQSYLDKEYYSFAYVIAKNSFGVKSKYRDSGREEVGFDLDDVKGNYTLISSDDLFSGNFRPEDLTGKIVIMGYMGEAEDFFYVDRLRTEKVNGVEIHAAIVSELIDN